VSLQDRQLRGLELEDDVGRRDHETSHVKTAAEVIFRRPKMMMRFPLYETIPISSVASVEINKKCVGRVQTSDWF
jgi:hypothetical protein